MKKMSGSLGLLAMFVASLMLVNPIETSAQRRSARVVKKPRVVATTPRPVVTTPVTNRPARIIRRRTANGITCYGWDYVKKVYVPRACPAT